MRPKKQTTSEQLEEVKAMLKNMPPGRIVSVDRELQARNETLMALLYGAAAKHGVSIEDFQNGSGFPDYDADANDNAFVGLQVPIFQIPANQQLEWEVTPDGRHVMVYIVRLRETSTGSVDAVNEVIDEADSILDSAANKLKFEELMEKGEVGLEAVPKRDGFRTIGLEVGLDD
jgi:hypothetical protein